MIKKKSSFWLCSNVQVFVRDEPYIVCHGCHVGNVTVRWWVFHSAPFTFLCPQNEDLCLNGVRGTSDPRRVIYLNHLFGRLLRKHHRSHNSLYQCSNWDVPNSWAIMKGSGAGSESEDSFARSISLISCRSRLEICLSQTTTEEYGVIMPSCGPTMCWAVALLFPCAYTGKT